MSRIIIAPFPTEQKSYPEEVSLNISELFCDTIQGEGIYTGYPAVFMRLQHCVLNCQWCDTDEVWRQGNPYSIKELLDIFDGDGLVDLLAKGHHLIITGGSPLFQQFQIIDFINSFKSTFGFKPFIEIENEGVLRPHPTLTYLVDCWNNSPKLSNSGNTKVARYKLSILSYLSSLPNSWFKFVVNCEEDWEEIQSDFIDTKYIKKSQIILMPEGITREQILINQHIVIPMAIKHNVIFSTRLHILAWDKTVSV